MPKTETKTPLKKHNPFLTDKANELWKHLDEQGNQVTKEELLKRAKTLRTAKNQVHK